MSIRIYGNRLIKTLPGDATRPTPAKVREALFNSWQGRISGSRWLDLCAGSGAMGASIPDPVRWVPTARRAAGLRDDRLHADGLRG